MQGKVKFLKLSRIVANVLLTFCVFVFSFGLKTDEPNHEKKTAELLPSISPAGQTSLSALPGEPCHLIDHSL